MSTSAIDRFPTVLNARAESVRFDQFDFTVQLVDGRSITVPYEWYPRLRDATEVQRREWRLIGRGVGIHWEAIDEDISVAELLGETY
jgi:hypothetical protein